jgi:ABC-type phosphate transport system substrate-binding protein
MGRLLKAARVAAASVLALVLPLPAGAGAGYVVVVNEANPLAHLSRAELSKLFLRRATAWPGGTSARPCDLSGTSATRKTFSQDVHGKPVWVITAFWQQEIASGRGVPPAVCASEQAALEAVRDDPGGVAYVGEGVPLGEGVKPLVVDR